MKFLIMTILLLTMNSYAAINLRCVGSKEVRGTPISYKLITQCETENGETYQAHFNKVGLNLNFATYGKSAAELFFSGELNISCDRPVDGQLEGVYRGVAGSIAVVSVGAQAQWLKNKQGVRCQLLNMDVGIGVQVMASSMTLKKYWEETPYQEVIYLD
ncbi:MAG: DUF992 domain-containing protein [Bacteriovoracaceae bacterium]